MGIIQRQGIKQSLVNFFGVFVAAISIIFIYPMDKATYGLARFVIDTSIFFSPFILMGLASVSIRFFPNFRDDKNHNGFLFFLVSMLLLSSIAFAIGAYIFSDELIGFYAEKEPIYRMFLPHLVPLSIIISFFTLFYMYCTNFNRIVVPSLYQNLIKISLPVLVLLFVLEKISIEFLVNGIIVSYFISLVGIFAYTIWLGELKLKPDFKLFTPTLKKDIGTYAMYSLVGGLGTVVAFRIDSIMISSMIDFENNGAYNIAAFIANVIAIPTGAIMQISAPIVSHSFKEKNLSHINFLYKESSINLLVIGLFLFVAIIVSVEDLFSIMFKDEIFHDGFKIVMLVGLAKVIDMGTSINNHIINYSEFYRFNFIAMIFMAVFNIVANYIFIPQFGIVGVALATVSAITLYNVVKMIFVYVKFKMQPFTPQTLKIISLAILCFLIGIYLPTTDMVIVNIILRSIVIALVYAGAVFYFEISKELNGMVIDFLKKYGII